jgi:hypothetical protein
MAQASSSDIQPSSVKKGGAGASNVMIHSRAGAVAATLRTG